MRDAVFSRISVHARVVLVGALVAAVAVVSSQRAEAGTHATFRTPCDFSHSLNDDPIVFPNAPGASHLHDFFGNTTTDAFSTYESLQAGDTPCDRAADTAAYWVPALFMNGEKIDPFGFVAYYRGGGKVANTIQAPPADLRVIAGDHRWECPIALPGVDATQGCPSLSNLQLRLFFPDCWDGKNLDSPDHRSHMAYSAREAGSNDHVCPSSYPDPIPRIEFIITYQGVTAPWTLSSGSPATAHGDFFNAWDQAELERLVRQCLNTGLGNGVTCPV